MEVLLRNTKLVSSKSPGLSRCHFVGITTKSQRTVGRPYRMNFLRLAGTGCLSGVLLLSDIPLVQAEEDQVILRRQLRAAEKTKDNPAMVELCRRILEIYPKDSAIWEILARKQLELNDADRCAASLDAWQASVRPVPKIIDDLRGDLANARRDYKAAERYWSSYVRAVPEAADTLEKLAKLADAAGRWLEATELRTRLLAQKKICPVFVARANDYLELRAWDKAFADLQKANSLDPSDSAVKDQLPRFERLKTMLPRLKTLDAELAKTPQDPFLWLDRARLFTLSEYPRLALKDCQQAMALAPEMLRARIQCGEALLDLNRIREAANLDVSRDLQRDKNRHVSDEILRALGAADKLVLANPDQAGPLLARAQMLSQFTQPSLALADANLALKLDPSSAPANYQAAKALATLGRTNEAIAHAEKATLLDPRDALAWYYRGILEARRANLEAAIAFQTRSLGIQESSEALREREKCERRLGRDTEADSDAQRRKQLPTRSE